MLSSHSSASSMSSEEDYYSASAQRLAHALAKLGLFSNVESLIDMLLDNFSYGCFSYVSDLFGPAPSWQLVELGPECPDEILRRHDVINQASSVVEALAFVLEEFDYSRTQPDQIRVTGPVIELLMGGQRLVRIRPVQFEPVDELGRQRASTTMKGLRNRDYGNAVSRLQRLPGLEKLKPPSYVRVPYAAEGSPLNITASELAARLRCGLVGMGITVSQSQALELTAQLFKAPSWQHLVAKEKAQAQPVLPPMHLTADPGHDTEEPQFKCYRTTADALWAFSVTAKQHASTGEPVTFYGGDDGDITLSINNMGGLKNAPHVTCYCPPSAYASELYLDLAERMLASPDGVSASLADELGMREPSLKRRDLISARVPLVLN